MLVNLIRLNRLVFSGPLSVGQLAELIDEKPIAIIKFLMADLGVMASMTQNLDPATCVAIVEGFGKILGGDEDEDDEERYAFLFLAPYQSRS